MFNKFWKRFRLLMIILLVGIVGITGILSSGRKAYADESNDNLEVKPGIEVLLDDHLDWLEGKRVGLITNPTGVTSELESSIDVLYNHPDVNLTALYGPEHGIRADRPAGEHVDSYIDDKTGLPVYSLYGATWTPTEEMLEDVDVLLFDIQDIDSNVYTYIYTLGFAMEGAAEHDKELIVLDRPNPNGGTRVEGPVRKAETVSFMGRFLLPIRHGMTIGELATMWNQEYNLGTDLKVAEMKNWKRDMLFEDTELPWVMPSPNIPTEDTAHLYAGTELLDDTILSEGLGTTRPFELVGAPWIDSEKLADDMNNLDLAGVTFRPAHFTPTSGQYQGELVAGVQVHLDDPSKLDQVELGLNLITVMRDQNPANFEMDDNYAGLIGDPVAADMLKDGEPVEDIIASWEDELNTWIKDVRDEYLLYSRSIEDNIEVAAEKVSNILATLPTAGNVKLEDKEAIEAGRTAYDELTFVQQNRVVGYALDRLTNAEAELEILEDSDLTAAKAVADQLATLPTKGNVELKDKEAIEAGRKAYDALSSTQQETLVNDWGYTLDRLINAEAELGRLDHQVKEIKRSIYNLPKASELT